MNRSSKQKINKEILTLNDTLDQLDIIDIYRATHQKTAPYTSFSSARETFSRIDPMLKHKTSLKNFKIEIILSIFSKRKALQMEINCKKKAGKTTTMWRLSNMLPKNDYVMGEIKGEIKRYTETSENENTNISK
uniref:Uncharacterized protein n=1 Tax=Rousettus aegyptiacus TaxID=9407 RepID=A0A7J8E8R6_ROUAE|nr:hypothetical protein HJG63_008201 [Rousettus aegyptiacus]